MKKTRHFGKLDIGFLKEMKSFFGKPIYFLLFFFVLCIHMFLIPVYQTRLQDEMAELNIKLDKGITIMERIAINDAWEDVINDMIAGTRDVEEVVRNHPGGSKGYLKDYLAIRDYYLSTARDLKHALSRYPSRDYQEGRIKFALYQWLDETAYHPTYRLEAAGSEDLDPRSTFGEAKWQEIQDRLGIVELAGFKYLQKRTVDTSALLQIRSLRHEAIHWWNLYERGYPHPNASLTNGYVFGIELNRLPYLLVYVGIAAALALTIQVEFFSKRLALIYVPVLKRSGYYRRRFAIALCIIFLFLIGTEVLAWLFRVILDPTIDFLYPMRIFDIRHQIQRNDYFQYQIPYNILPISVSHPNDFFHFVYMPIGIVNLLLLLYRIVLLTLVVALSFLLVALYRWRKRWFMLSILAVAGIMGVMAMLETSANLLMLFDPYSLIQGKGAVPFIYALVILMFVTGILYRLGKSLSMLDDDVTH